MEALATESYFIPKEGVDDRYRVLLLSVGGQAGDTLATAFGYASETAARKAISKHPTLHLLADYLTDKPDTDKDKWVRLMRANSMDFLLAMAATKRVCVVMHQTVVNTKAKPIRASVTTVTYGDPALPAVMMYHRQDANRGTKAATRAVVVPICLYDTEPTGAQLQRDLCLRQDKAPQGKIREYLWHRLKKTNAKQMVSYTTSPTTGTYSHTQLHTTAHNCTQLHTATHSYTQLHTATYSHTQLQTAAHTYTRLRAATHSCTQLLTAAHSYAQLHTATHSYTQLHTTPHNSTQLHTTPHSYTQLHTATHSYTQLCTDTRSHTQLHTTTHNYTQLCAATHSCTKLHTATHSYAQPHTATNNYTRQHTAAHSCTQLHTAAHSGTQLCTATYSYTQLHTATHSYT